MRILMWFVMGFAAACAVGIYITAGQFFLILAGIFLLASIPLFVLRSPLPRIAALILLGFCVGAGWVYAFDAIYLQPAKAFDSQKVTGTLTVSDYSYETDYGVAADARIYIQGRRYKVRVYLVEGESLIPGDTVTGNFSLRMTTPDSKKGSTYHQGKGIFLLAYADEKAVVEKAEKVPLDFLGATLRKKITDRLDDAFPEDTRGFARALLLGDSSLLTYEEDTAFKVSGIRHIIAVSGLHISILFALIMTVSTRRGLPAALIGFPVLFLFAAIAGFTPSVVRSCVMQGLMILALLFDKEYDPPTALAFAVLVMLGINPMTITSVSFQLSVGCLIGIFLFYQKLYDFWLLRVPATSGKSRLSRTLRGIFASISITLSAMTVTTPLCAAYFGMVSIVGILTNLLTLWVVSFVFYGIMLVCALGFVWGSGATILARIVSWPMRYVLGVSDVMSKFMLASVYTESVYVVIWLVFAYVLLTVFFLGRRKHPALMAACMAGGLVLAVAVSWIEPLLSNYRFTVLDVGQGQCILWQCDGKTYMVDCGGDDPETTADTAAQYLLSQGINRLDGMILTHYDEDHSAGVLPFMTRIRVDTLYLPDIDDETSVRQKLEDTYGDRIVWVDKAVGMRTDNMCVILYPSENKKSGNESGMCVLFQSQECDILITGDRNAAGEKELLAYAGLPDLEILVAGHHGSKYATSLELLHETKPETVIISVGADNSYGHPAEEMLRRLRQFGCSIWRTDLDKTIVFKG